MSRRVLRRFGERPYTVVVYVEDRHGRRVCMQWRARGRVRTRSWPDSPANRQHALKEGGDYAAERRTIARDQRSAEQGQPVTLRQLWDRYTAVEREHWRAKTTKGYAGLWRVLEDYFDAGAPITGITLDQVDAFRVRRRKQGIAHGQIRRQIGFLRQLLNWAEARGLLPTNRLRSYRYWAPKDERRDLPGEYTRAELLKIATELSEPRAWRARCIIKLCGSTGKRIHAVLHLQWTDVELSEGVVNWPAEFDKNGRAHRQPLTPLARAALEETSQHRREDQPWVFWPGQARTRAAGRPYHYNSVHYHLREAERRASVPHHPGRAFHGLRKLVAGDVRRAAGAGAAAAWLNDTSLVVVAEHYDKVRGDDIEAARAAIAAQEATA